MWSFLDCCPTLLLTHSFFYLVPPQFQYCDPSPFLPQFSNRSTPRPTIATPNPCSIMRDRLLKSAWALLAPKPSGYALNSRRSRRSRAEVKQMPILIMLALAPFHCGNRVRITRCYNRCVLMRYFRAWALPTMVITDRVDSKISPS